MRTGINMVEVKRRNRSAILAYINEHGPVSRKDIAAATGLTAASVTQNCGALIEEGILTELGNAPIGDGEVSRAGRKKMLLGINEGALLVLSVAIETNQTTMALGNLGGGVLWKENISTRQDLEAEDFLALLAEKCAGHLAALKNKKDISRIAGVSITVPGIVDREKGVAVSAYGVWDKSVAAADVFSEKLKNFMIAKGIPERVTDFAGNLMLENNVNAFANAELLFGEGKRYDNLLVVKWGPGVGATIVIGSEVYEGRNRKAAELGHFIVEKGGMPCACGRHGCLETKVSYKALQAIKTFASEEFGQAYEAGDEAEKAGFDEAIDLFARSLMNTITILAPNRVILCGSLFASPVIRERLELACRDYAAGEEEGSPQILYTTLADREDYIGPLAQFIKTQIF